MDGGDPDMPNPKRLRLDSVYNALPPPPTAQHSRHPSHPTQAQASSPPQPRHPYPPPNLPPPSHSSSPGYYGPPASTPSTSLPPSDIRNLSDPTRVPHRVHGIPVTHSPRVFPPDSISTYRPPPTPHQTSAPDVPGPRKVSTSDERDSKPPMAHGGPPASWHVNQDPRNGATMSNGYPPAISPVQQNDPPYHTPPLPPSQHYAQPPPSSVGAYSPSPYMNQYAQGPGQMRRKQVRATQACNHCRSRKQKCDEARPCQFCRENHFDCQYKDVPVPKQDRSMMQLQDSINTIADTLKTFVANFDVWKQSVEGRLPQTAKRDFMSMAMDQPSPPDRSFGARGSASEQQTSRMPTPMQPRSHMSRVNSMKQESPAVLHAHASPATTPHTSTPVKHEHSIAPAPPATPAESVDHVQGTGKVGQDPDALETDHSTPAHKILPLWASTYNLEQNIPALKRLADLGKSITDYPLYYEQERGLLRVWGVGEGYDYTDGVQGVASPDSHTDSDAPSPASFSGREGLWGYYGDHSSPSTVNSDNLRHHDPVGVSPQGRPDFRLSTMRALYDSYMTHIHVLHPILHPRQLDKMIETFSKTYGPDARTNTMSPAAIPEHLHPSLKRKRSSSGMDGHGSGDEYPKVAHERSLRNAIIFLVLALGKVCEHKGHLPSPQADRSPVSNPAFDSPYSTHSSFRSEDTDHRLRNIDVLPGVAYFTYASDIIGNQTGGNTVAHAQALILGALYLAQFGRVLESWSWISNACRVALVLIKADFPRINRNLIQRDPSNEAAQAPIEPPLPKKEQHRLNLVKIVYWTCLSLETDILAEMSTLPSTQVSRYQSDIMYPAGVYEHAPEVHTISEFDMEHFLYSSQIHLRVLLNGTHMRLYAQGNEARHGTLRSVFYQAEFLSSWRAVLPTQLAWDDKDPPAVDLNIARLRAKVHGAMYVILRPCLWEAIQKFELAPPDLAPHELRTAPSPYASSPASGTEHSRTASTNTTTGSTGSKDGDLIRHSHHCIMSAIQSTIAFDRVGADPDSPYENYVSTRRGRLILTNIVGTLHA
ncbi:hypothetical protein P280DRAFT_37287 [Massarina eburnea CBS 473.64]|uniref:Zn(2)-C6 fungal-type domain-containing protein n=1 Tax=Massarina eburnea CBS 473.64 TaxID=1395130 RepID=A0A6A6RG97_9PLEO|nr:hypothetical protein P280DRAFT_37287 [Massarina eburnea CBS 473.64]